jgi:hypothetical protein
VKQPSDAAPIALNRRQFLIAGGTLGAGSILIRVHPAHGAEDAVAAYSCAPFQSEMDKEPPFGDADFYEDAEFLCEKYDTAGNDLPDADDRKCERVLAKLWISFAQGAYAEKPFTSIEDGAIREGVSCIRGHIMPDPDAFPLADHLEKWRLMGGYAAGQAMGGALTRGHFKFGWNKPDTYRGVPCKNKKIGNVRNRATEVIGHHLWTMYTMGVLSYGGFDKEPVSDDVIAKGRIQSRRHVFRNVGLLEVVKPHDTEPTYTRWHFNEVGCCAYICGRRAARAAKVKGHAVIAPEDFEKGWCETSLGFRRLGLRQGVPFRSAGCG